MDTLFIKRDENIECEDDALYDMTKEQGDFFNKKE